MLRPPLAASLATLAALSCFATLGVLRHRPHALRGDEGTYVAMTASLVRDGDLAFGEADAAWARAWPERPAPLILERTPRGVAYSKPVLFPLLAAPFYAAAGRAGFWILNALVLAAALALARAALARRAGGEAALSTVLLFTAASTIVPYLAWQMTESLQVALATAGLALALAGELGPPPATARGTAERLLASPRAPWAGAALLGLLVALREPNAAVAAVPALAALGARRLRRAAALAAVAAAAYGLLVLVTWGLTGAPNPYKTPRSTFLAETGYPLPSEPQAMARFEPIGHLATSRLGLVPELEPALSAYATLYFFVGRHSGMLVYLPAALALLAAAVAGSDRAGRAALAGFAAAAGFYLVWWPTNYFGGETCVGNRYLLAAYPCLLFAPARLPSARWRAAAWAVGFVVAASALVSVGRTRELERSSQNHAYAGLFRWLPYESTAPAVEGRRDRYWRGDFVRFVDPYVEVEPASFVVAADGPAAELEIATFWNGEPFHWLAESNAPDAALVVSDWLRSRRIPLAARSGGGAGGPVSWSPSPAWRVHPFWWRSEPAYRARLVRLRLESTTPGATARLRYLGRRGVPERGFGREVLAVVLPTSAVAGERALVPVRVAHRGEWAWSSSDTLPVHLAAVLVAADGSGTYEQRVPLPERVRPGETLDAAVELEWPRTPGRYRLTVDLVLEGVAWFGDRVGAPLASGEVTVLPAPAASPAPSRP